MALDDNPGFMEISLETTPYLEKKVYINQILDM